MTSTMASPHTFTVKNCLMINNSSPDFEDTGSTGTLTFDYNATDDPASGTANPRGAGVDMNDNTSSEWDNAVTNRASGDLTIKDASSLLYGAGVPNSTDPNVPTTDYFGNTRTRYDIGAFESQAVAAAPTILTLSNSSILTLSSSGFLRLDQLPDLIWDGTGHGTASTEFAIVHRVTTVDTDVGTVTLDPEAFAMWSNNTIKGQILVGSLP